MDRETRTSLITLGVLGAMAALAWWARSALGLEWDAESVRDRVRSWGAWGPVLFVTLVTFRMPLFLPSQVLLVAGGLVFGAAAGAVYGALGMVLAGIWVFLAARYAGREAVLSNVPESMRWAFDAAGARAGAAVVMVGTGYPVGPVSAFHAGAGLTAMALPIFIGAAAVGAAVRGIVYATFGSALLEGEAWQLTVAAVLLLAVAGLPLLHPRVRAWARRRLQPEE